MEDDSPQTVTREIPIDLVEGVDKYLDILQTNDRTELERFNKDTIFIVNNRNKLKKLDLPQKNYIQQEELSTAYLHALDADNPPTVKDCFDKVEEVHNVSQEYLEEVKYNPTFHVADVVDEHKSHKVSKRMQKDKILDISALKKSSTPNQLITSITEKRSILDRIERLEESVQQLESTSKQTEVNQAATQIALSEIIPKHRRKEHSHLLREQGYSIRQISIALGVDERTVKRYLLSSVNTSPL